MTTMDVQEKYNNLREQILSAVPRDIDERTLIELKNHYSDDIRSQRKLDSINNLNELIKVLETRDVLNSYNIEPYYCIVKKVVSDPAITLLLTEYENWFRTVQQPQLYNMYMNEHGEYIVRIVNPQGNNHINNNVPNNEDILASSFHNNNSLQESTVTSTQLPECLRLIASSETNVTEYNTHAIWQQEHICTSTSSWTYLFCLLIICVIIMIWIPINLLEAKPQVVQTSTSHIFDQINSTRTSAQSASISSSLQEVYINKTFSRDSDYNSKEEAARVRLAVIHCIGDRLGRSWRDVARFLNIREYQIDEIQNKHPFNLKEQSYEALHLCLSHYSTDKWKIYLMQALEKGRRRDLKELAEQIILTGECNI